MTPLLPIFGLVPDCDWVQERIAAFIDFDLSLREFRAIERHLRKCADCHAEFNSVESLLWVLHGFDTPEAEAENERACAAIMARIREYEEGKKNRPIWNKLKSKR